MSLFRCSHQRYLQAVLLLAFLVRSGFAQTLDQFTVVLLPDTQFYSESYPFIFYAQTQWIADHIADMNIKFVIGLGDVVNKASEIAQWQNADAAVKTIEGKIPYFLAIGNKDYQGTLATRTVANFNSYFGPNRYAGYSWYLGNYPLGSNENFFGIVNVNGKDYLILLLEFLPRNEALAWADTVLNNNSGKETIVVTHSFMNTDNTRVDTCDSTGNYTLTGNRGEDMWNSFVARHPNIIMVVNGHTSFTGRRVDLGTDGNLVNQVLSDYQADTNGGNGYLRILKFKPLLNQIDVSTYSPYLNTYKTDSANQFTVNYHNPGVAETVGTINGKARIAKIGSTQDCQAVPSVTVATSSRSALTSTSGSYTLSNLAPNAYSVTAAKTGWVTQTQSVQVNAGYTSRLEFFMVPPLGQISGTVTDAAGRPIAGAAVNIVGGMVNFSKKLTTSSIGSFSSPSISVGNYTVTASKTGFPTQTQTAMVSSNMTSMMNITLQ